MLAVEYRGLLGVRGKNERTRPDYKHDGYLLFMGFPIAIGHEPQELNGGMEGRKRQTQDAIPSEAESTRNPYQEEFNDFSKWWS